ncbi:MAG: YopX protein [Clostridiaceae bacterium]|jgi:hypothetical protein|nr:YopX protein [Clostridiaceae bacterium]
MIDLKLRYVFKNEKTKEIVKIVYNLKEIEQGEAEFTKNQLWNEGYSLIATNIFLNMTDINNKEMFDGDIVKAKGIYYEKRGEEIGVIKRTTLLTTYFQNFSGFSDDYLGNYNEFEIIGTEYENPELIADLS